MWRPNFICMDVGLPVMGGLEAARRIRELEGGRDVKIVAVTAAAYASQRDEVLAAGFDDFLRKPYRPEEIFDCIARHLGVRFQNGAGPQAAAGDLPATLRPEDLAALPAALRNELENAVISLDRNRIALILRQVSEQNTSLANALTRLAEQFAYTTIFDALESCKTKFTEANGVSIPPSVVRF